MTIDELIRDLPNRNIVSETDVHTKFAIDLFKLLDYPDEHRADRFPLYIYEGSTSQRKEADIVYFDSPDHATHREREDHEWVEKHSLLLVELKSPTEPISAKAQGQAKSYAIWGRVPFYVITNSKRIAVYRLENYTTDSPVLSSTIENLPSHWAELERTLRPEAVRKYIQQNKFKFHDPENTDYSDYIRAKHSELQNSLNDSLSRTISDYPELPQFRMYVSLNSDSQKESLKCVPATDLIQLNESLVLLAEPGGGKTHFCQMLAQAAIDNFNPEENKPVPVILLGQHWKKKFKSIPEGICEEVKPFISGLNESVIVDDIRKKKVFASNRWTR